ncbi:unnamed protein product [Adineta steineri]|uniref:NHL repeat containing protein-like protein n=2 Tax=Adineta steineri TaxID=433720 RepID=A0A814CPT3_9BILA|nr:unnamed protein product [Adineta steineri]
MLPKVYIAGQVVKRSLNDAVVSTNRVAAGTGTGGSDSDQLRSPHGIFVDVNLDLYVADCGNDRIQLFQSGESNGITVAGSTSLNPTIILDCPSGIILDAEKYLFIVDQKNHRVIGSSWNGFRCLVGCYGMGSQSNQLSNPFSFSFDHSGNMFVTDQFNHRIQKFLLMNDSFALSFNQPKFSPTPIWDSNGITIANQSIVGREPFAIFVNTNNTVYVANKENNTVVIWEEERANPTNIIHGNFTEPNSLFVTSNGDIYIGDGIWNSGVHRWSAKTNIFVTVMNVNFPCHGLFVDINDTLYCSMSARHDKVVKRSLNDPVMTSNRVAAGTGFAGNASNQLSDPRGIFVDVNLDLYVADYENHRVQLFQPGESNGITVAGSKSLNPTITLRGPSGIILDTEKYLFIVDHHNHRIVGSGLNGFRCLVGCYGVGSQSNQLNYPSSLSFDHSGNIFVADEENARIQKFLLMKDSFALSFYQPKFCSTAIRNSNGITFADQSIVGQSPTAIFVSTNNTIYVANREKNTIVMYQEENINPTNIIHGNFTEPNSLFVTSNGDIYIDDGYENGRVQKWIAETNTFVTVMNVNSSCWGLFVDINDTLYCSMLDHHQVVKISLNDSVMSSNHVAAGTGIGGPDSNQLKSPRGIFVDVNLDLYVADCDNDRVQLFQSGESNGITVAGSHPWRKTITLSCPSGIILDAEKYLFIADQNNHRIVGSNLDGFRCLVGCDGMGSQSNQLNQPFSFSFDHSGNIFVADHSNHRIQKFKYLRRLCGKSKYDRMR